MSRIWVVVVEDVTENDDHIAIGDSELYDRADWRALADDSRDALERARAEAAERWFAEEDALNVGLPVSTQFVGVEVRGPDRLGRYQVRDEAPGRGAWGPWLRPAPYGDGTIETRAVMADIRNVPAPWVASVTRLDRT